MEGPRSTCPQNSRVGWPHWPTGKIVDGGEQPCTRPVQITRNFVRFLTRQFATNRARYVCTMDKSYKVALDIGYLFPMSDLEQRAIEVLNRSRRQRRRSIEPAVSFPGLNRMPSLNGESDLKGTPSIVGMRQWLDQLGHSVLVDLCHGVG